MKDVLRKCLPRDGAGLSAIKVHTASNLHDERANDLKHWDLELLVMAV